MLWALTLIFAPLVSFGQLTDIDPDDQNLCVDIKTNLRLRDRHANTNNGVALLQDFLQEKGFLKSEPTGFFGQATLSAVKAF